MKEELRMKERSELLSIEVDRIYPHPNNPRKDVGDIVELTESVKKNGIMQNLTIIPKDALEEEPDEQPDVENITKFHGFYALIGHRRLAAAKAAGLTEVPCRIVSKISLKEQISIMLEENMQRNDLTIYEQAQGFQMMLDLGETAETIAEKTGFSKATVYHRLNLAKLDQGELEKKEKDDNFQLTLKDLYELEKVSDIGTRNKILSEARNSSDLSFRASNAAKEEKRQKFLEDISVLMEAEGIKPAPAKAKDERWSGKWESLKEYNMNKDVPDKISVKARKTDELFYVRWFDSIYIIRKAIKEDKKLSKAERERQEKDRRKKQIKGLTKQLVKKAKDYIRCIIEGKISPIKETEILRKQILDAAVKNGLSMWSSSIVNFIAEKEVYKCTEDEIKSAESKYDKLTFINQLFVMLHNSIESSPELVDYYGKYNQEKAKGLIAAFDLLELYGWTFEDEERKLLDGTHELYVKEEK